MEIVDFSALTAAQHADAARVLREALAHLPSGYRAPGEAEAEVRQRRTQDDWLGLAALDGERLIGWIGALRTYHRGWEIHPLVVAPGRIVANPIVPVEIEPATFTGILRFRRAASSPR